MSNKFFRERIYFSFLFIFTIAPFIVISFYNHPSADDFCFSNVAMEMGFWDAQAKWYNDWTGRYFSTALLSIGPVVNKSVLQYKILPIIIMAILFFSIVTLIRQISPSLSAKFCLMGACIILLLYLAGAPSIVEGFYWMPGYVTYQYGNIATFFLLAVMTRLYRAKENRSKIWLFLLSTSLVLAIVGSNETIMLILLAILLFINIYIVCVRKQMQKWFLALLAIAVLASAFVVLAPGNTVRLGIENSPLKGYNFFVSIYMSLYDAAYHLASWLSQGTLILFTLFFIPVAANFSKKNSHGHRMLYIHPLIGVSLFLVLISISYFPAYWSLGHTPPPRTQNVTYLMFVVGWFYVNYLCVTYYIKTTKKPVFALPLYSKIFICILIFFSLVDEGNIKKAYADLLTGRAYKYDQELKRRHELILASKEKTLVLPTIKAIPETIYFRDITSNKSHWRNACYSGYIDKEAVVIRNNKIEPPPEL